MVELSAFLEFDTFMGNVEDGPFALVVFCFTDRYPTVLLVYDLIDRETK